MTLKQHHPAGWKPYNKREREKRRGSSSKRGYGYQWQKARERFLKANPLCVHCECEGHATIATDVDHITPHKGDKTLFWVETNWQSLCKPHHSSKTASEDGGFGNKRK